MSHSLDTDIAHSLARIADALERMAPKTSLHTDFNNNNAFIWDATTQSIAHVQNINCIPLKLLQGIDHTRDILLQNTLQFHQGYAANNALLWGARGMGKSSLIKAIHCHINDHSSPQNKPLKLIEIHREDITTLPNLMKTIINEPYHFVIFCDDLSFDNDDISYKALKSALDGGVEGRPANCIFYATSNRRHLMPRDMIENERSTAIAPSEAAEEKVSLSDRFGLWLGIHKCSQDSYLSMIESYIAHFQIPITHNTWRQEALEWTATRGYRSGRTAWQFIQDLAGRNDMKLAEK